MAALEIHQCEAPAIVSIFLLSGATDALLGAVLAERKPLWVGAASGLFYTREMNPRGYATLLISQSPLARGSVRACCFGSLISNLFEFSTGPSP